jgi:hypothetical protein
MKDSVDTSPTRAPVGPQRRDQTGPHGCLALFLLSLAFSGLAGAEVLIGEVVRMVDGDTVLVLDAWNTQQWRRQ